MNGELLLVKYGFTELVQRIFNCQTPVILLIYMLYILTEGPYNITNF